MAGSRLINATPAGLVGICRVTHSMFEKERSTEVIEDSANLATILSPPSFPVLCGTPVQVSFFDEMPYCSSMCREYKGATPDS